MSASARNPLASTHQRLLDAAARVFAQKGLEGATTREIARQAEVNEVTLFRHFHSKEKLLGEVLQRTFDKPEAAAAPTVNSALPEFRAELQRFAVRYEELLRRNILLIRTLLGEIHRHREHEKSVLHGIFAPLKADLVASLQAARDGGALRPEIEPVIAADLFSGSILFDVLRRSGPFAPEYSSEQYLRDAVETFARGIER